MAFFLGSKKSAKTPLAQIFKPGHLIFFVYSDFWLFVSLEMGCLDAVLTYIDFGNMSNPKIMAILRFEIASYVAMCDK